MYTKKTGSQKKNTKHTKISRTPRWNPTWCQGPFVCLVYKQNSYLHPVASTKEAWLPHPPMVATHRLGGAAFLFTR